MDQITIIIYVPLCHKKLGKKINILGKKAMFQFKPCL